MNITTKGLKYCVVCCVCLLAAQVLVGCADMQAMVSKANELKEQAYASELDLRSQAQLLQTERDRLDNNSTNAAHLDAIIAQINAKIDILSSVIQQADLVINEAQSPSSPITLAADSISPWIPAPAQGPIVLGAALIATFFRSHNLKKNATSIIQSIEHTMSKDPQFRDLFEQHADSIRTIQTPGARKMIDTTVGKTGRSTIT